ncbi:DKNYY domain-containing protein [Burkholderia cepacia]|uniref:DKNYY domain-containing protein n=1 Tax=Burkholderia cepacia TaxID=292 RepID=UPI00158B1A6B|nr:DKNYY domain-containing protein [Burkholderia cepacia]
MLEHLSKRMMILRLVLSALLGVSMQAHAFTTSTCEETWYVPVPGHAFAGTNASWKEVKKGTCTKHDVKAMGVQRQMWDDYNDQGSGAGESGTFALVDGKGYFIHREDVYQGPYCGGGDVPGFDPQCMLPRAARHNEVHRYRAYYLVTSSRGLDPVSGCKSSYATDGQSIFYLTTDHSSGDGTSTDTPFRIAEADGKSFKCFVPQGGTSDDSWAFDTNHVFFEGKTAKGMSPGYPVQVFENRLLSISDLAINGDNAFTFDYTDGVNFLTRIDGQIKILSKAFFADRTNVFDQGFKKLAGVRPEEFSVVTPACPVPGQPELQCVAPTGQNDTGGYGIQDGVLFIPRGEPEGIQRVSVQGLDARKAIVFLLDGSFGPVYGVSAFMLLDGRLYSIDALRKDTPAKGVPVHGPLRSIKWGTGCVLNGDGGGGLNKYILDDRGGIDMAAMKHVGPCAH